ncbi:SIR2 family protein [Gemmatimonas groenlandica]|uniref:Uncharacterized protein n=1 Tax=Gemmatimonas groenlandica TaxID=2732249 RepID=A0A6M4IP70_9BACT|nr:SIR2 family protein [Gemmatimonas groenlandica]QJR35226.1 hypothetical protein HKW67_06765 [Gemmatimonas groenlandica]
MLLIIAGAGASLDSVPFTPPHTESAGYQLPLADQLFGVSQAFLDIQTKYPALKQISTRLHFRSNGKTVEDVLAEMQEEAKHNPARHRQLVAVRYYLQELIDTCEQRWYRGHSLPTNMIALLDQIENARLKHGGGAHPCFITFNYDRIIENALSNRGHTFNNISDYTAANRPALLKLHGSVDWVRPVTGLKRPPRDNSRNEVAERMGEEFHEIVPEQVGEIKIIRSISSTTSEEGIHLPAIAIPTKGKSFECPESHVEELRKILPEVRCILTIGWRAQEDHFLVELRRLATKPIVGICVGANGHDADPVTKQMMRTMPRSEFRSFDGRGFSDFVRNHGVERLSNLEWHR